MRYRSAAAFREALETRLAERARATGVAPMRLRKLVVFDRLLARLLAVAAGRWLLKGALALDFRYPAKARATKEEAAVADFLAVQSLDLDDFFNFAIEKLSSDLADVGARRFRVRAELAGRLFDTVAVDVGFDDPLEADPELVRGPDLLAFAEISPLDVPALSLEQHVAERVHAYTRHYGGGRPSMRPKDLVDLLVIASAARLQAHRLRACLQKTFERRRTHDLPAELPEPPRVWRAAFRRLAEEVGVPSALRRAHKEAATFLNPVLTGVASGSWCPEKRLWRVEEPRSG